MRLDKFLSELGSGTRSALKQDIRKGLVSVNGVPVKRPETHIDPQKDQIRYKNVLLTYTPFRYYMMNKPQGVISATRDETDRTVLDLLPRELRKDLFPVGRLDRDTEGLLLLTNDGPLAHQLLSPGKHVDKTYFVRTDLPITEENKAQLEAGIDIGEKRVTLPAKIICTQEDSRICRITIQEGKFHQIKRMFAAVGLEVVYLKRLRMGPLTLDAELAPGAYRSLTSEEIAVLKGQSQHAET